MLSADYDECVYIEDYEKNSKQVSMDALKAMNEYVDNLMRAEIGRLAKEKEAKGETVTEEWIREEQGKLLDRILPIKDYKLAKQISDGLSGLRYDIVLNTQQY